MVKERLKRAASRAKDAVTGGGADSLTVREVKDGQYLIFDTEAGEQYGPYGDRKKAAAKYRELRKEKTGRSGVDRDTDTDTTDSSTSTSETTTATETTSSRSPGSEEILREKTIARQTYRLVRRPTDEKGKQYEYIQRVDGSRLEDPVYTKKQALKDWRNTVRQVRIGAGEERTEDRGPSVPGTGFGLDPGGGRQSDAADPGGFPPLFSGVSGPGGQGQGSGREQRGAADPGGFPALFSGVSGRQPQGSDAEDGAAIDPLGPILGRDLDERRGGVDRGFDAGQMGPRPPADEDDADQRAPMEPTLAPIFGEPIEEPESDRDREQGDRTQPDYPWMF